MNPIAGLARAVHLDAPRALLAAPLVAALVGCTFPATRAPEPSAHPSAGSPGAPAAALPARAAAPDDSLFRGLGGHDGIASLIERFIREIAADDVLRPRFRDVNIARFQRTLEEQLCAESGGGCTYTGDDMRRAHAGLDIRRHEFNAVVEALVRAMDAQDLPVPVQNRVLAIHAPKRADVLGE